MLSAADNEAGPRKSYDLSGLLRAAYVRVSYNAAFDRFGRRKLACFSMFVQTNIKPIS